MSVVSFVGTVSEDSVAELQIAPKKTGRKLRFDSTVEKPVNV